MVFTLSKHPRDGAECGPGTRRTDRPPGSIVPAINPGGGPTPPKGPLACGQVLPLVPLAILPGDWCG